jgi:YD repeat-containing protein
MIGEGRTQVATECLRSCGSLTYTYNALNQLTSDGSDTYEYDDNGNPIKTNGQTTHAYDRANQLLSYGGSSYAYDGEGNRVSQTVDSVATQYLPDVQPHLEDIQPVLALTETNILLLCLWKEERELVYNICQYMIIEGQALC